MSAKVDLSCHKMLMSVSVPPSSAMEAHSRCTRLTRRHLPTTAGLLTCSRAQTLPFWAKEHSFTPSMAWNSRPGTLCKEPHLIPTPALSDI